MMDRFDRELLNCVQRDSSRTAEVLALAIPLSPSAIARRLRKLRAQGWIVRTIALLSPLIKKNRLRAIVTAQLDDHADVAGKAALEKALLAEESVQYFYEVSGPIDFLIMFDCATMDEFNAVTMRLLGGQMAVSRFQSHFIKRELKFAPFVDLVAGD